MEKVTLIHTNGAFILHHDGREVARYRFLNDMLDDLFLLILQNGPVEVHHHGFQVNNNARTD